ncbi:MAG: hypothetical protein WC236_09800 [Gallionellaceae bacterium]|jgi:hypothetical protein
MTLHDRIDAHASFHLYQIQLEAEAAMKAIRRKAEFPARSEGQKRRWIHIKQGIVK